MTSHRLAWIGLLCATTASAEVDEIVVTAAKRSESYYEIPAVTITKPADFLVQEVRLVNDSRAPDLRKQEIVSTIEGMLKQASRDRSVALSYGQGFLEPVNLNEVALQIIEDNKRTDTSSVDLFVKVTLASGDDTRARIASLKQFIARIQKVGRTEIEAQGDVGLSIVDPEKYRAEILGRIAAENARLARAMGPRCHVKVAGLEGRVQWDRTSIAELTLYIPYGVEISDCSYEN